MATQDAEQEMTDPVEEEIVAKHNEKKKKNKKKRSKEIIADESGKEDAPAEEPVEEHVEEPEVTREIAETAKSMRKGKDEGGVKKTSISRSTRSGLTFPVGRVHRRMKEGRFTERIGAAAPVYMASVLEYLTAELLEEAGRLVVIKDGKQEETKRKRILPRHIMGVRQTDEEFDALFLAMQVDALGCGASSTIQSDRGSYKIERKLKKKLKTVTKKSNAVKAQKIEKLTKKSKKTPTVAI